MIADQRRTLAPVLLPSGGQTELEISHGTDPVGQGRARTYPPNSSQRRYCTGLYSGTAPDQFQLPSVSLPLSSRCLNGSSARSVSRLSKESRIAISKRCIATAGPITPAFTMLAVGAGAFAV